MFGKKKVENGASSGVPQHRPIPRMCRPLRKYFQTIQLKQLVRRKMSLNDVRFKALSKSHTGLYVFTSAL